MNGPSKVNGPAKVQSVDRALSLLDRVAGAAPEGETAARLAQQCDINRATAWRLLGALEDHGLVEREPGSNRYKLGFALLRMAAAAGYDGLVRKTRPILDRVCAQTGETADLAVAGLHGVTYVSEAQPPSVLQISWLRREVPLHATSTGKAFLAWLPTDEARSLLDDPLPAYTDTTVTDHEKLMDELALTRERGYAECSGELEGRLYGVSAPILSRADGRPLAVFGIWGFLDRVPASRFPELGKIAIAAAAEITAVMNT